MIKEGKVVGLNYILKSESGELLDQSAPGQPFLYLHGYGAIVPGLEEALEGKDKGFKSNVKVIPALGYGEHIPALIANVDRGMFPPEAEIEVGMRFQAEVDNNPVIFTVEDIQGNQVKVNGNHPLAGKTLYFDVEVVNIRDATEEEIDHGHIHGEGGHHH